ncbi:HD domain-containing protein [Micrococcus luteus]|uniref:HD domain-containing protein n=1 Tax=Micrococcus luteus TaxID=1270 RepID=UPI002A533E32|nr:HD domain-containing protein [Micrococcus luteus]MCV7554401.1 HD domain-containing protein [Micrococcus luteus]MCV7602065.1 HD domain-containing protein [Micrococcus luteus]MCV7663146.1 HD domain-containing protein [Micrococcus luteus]MCV7695747.1 HD domain-containing protein [Micrococcus luteus]
MSTQTTTPDDGHTPWAPADPSAAAEDPRAVRFAQRYAARPIPTEREADTRPVDLSPSTDYDRLWELIVPETRTRANDIHLPVCAAYATRLCDAYPEADRELVLTAIILHDTGWAHVDESRIVSEGFSGDWRKAAIRFEHEREGVLVAQRVLPALGHDQEFVDRVCEIIDGHDTRPVAYSLEDALVRDSDRLWRFDRAGILASSLWFGMAVDVYTDRLVREILPELITQAAHDMATADLARARALLRTDVIRGGRDKAQKASA